LRWIIWRLRRNQLRIEPEEMWNLLGGLEGLKRMQENATVLIALAAYAEALELL